VLTVLLVAPIRPSARSAVLKQGEKSFDWSIADVAVVLDRAPEGRWQRASVVLGAAAPVPWREPQAEAALVGQMIDVTVAHAASQAAIGGAVALRRNAYKLPILGTLVRRAVLQAADVTNQETVR
jgi:xanthine dehydrogenase YagS FAD-binding subunit